MRMLDNAGYRTGYIYRNPLVKHEVPRPKNDIEVPPAVSSLGYLLEEEEMYKQGLVFILNYYVSNSIVIFNSKLFIAFGRRAISVKEVIAQDGSILLMFIKKLRS